MHTLNSHQVPPPDCPFGGLIEESLGADRAVVSLTHGHPSLQGLCNPSRDSAQGCEGGATGAPAGACSQRRCGRYGSTLLAAGAAATGALRWLPVRPLQHCTGCRCGRYRSTALPPVAGACYRGMPHPCSSRTTALAAGAAATGALRCRWWLVPATGVCKTPVAARRTALAAGAVATGALH